MNKFSLFRDRNIKKIFTVIGVLFIFFFSVLLLGAALVFDTQIRSVESREITALTEKFDNEISNLTKISTYLTTVQFSALPPNFSHEDYNIYLRTQMQIEAIYSVSEAISEIYLNRDGKNYPSGSTAFDELNQKPFDNYGVFNNAHLLLSEESQIYIKGAPRVSSNGVGNTVFLAINGITFSEQIFKEQPDFRKAFITDLSGRILFSQRNSEVGETIEELLGSNITPKELSTRRIQYNGEQWYLSIQPAKNYSLYVVNMTQAGFYVDNIRNLLLLLVISSIIFLILAVVTAFIISEIHYKPIVKIMKTIGEPMFGETYRSDDCEYITQGIRRLNEEKDDLSNEVRHMLRELEYQQVIARQTQLCPHFIGNTLMAIDGLASFMTSDLDNPISSVIGNLSDVMHSALDIEQLMISIKDEIELTKKFAEIFMVRYCDFFTIEWDLDESVFQHNVIKLSIQPLLENATFHAFKESTAEDKNIILISIQREGDNIVFRVSDNGVGMDEETIQKVVNDANDFQTLSGSSVGLRNVNHRLKLLYGEEYGLAIISKIGKGTECSFRIPGI